MHSTLPLPEYLKKQNIPWFPIYLEVIDGVKKLQPYRETGKRPKTTDFKNLTAQEIQARHEWTTYKHIAIDTNNIQQIDIDDPEMVALFEPQNKPHFLSTTKKLPHIFGRFELPEALVGKNKFNLDASPKVDYLNGLWSFAPRDGEVVNADIDIGVVKIPDETIIKKYKDYNTDYSGVEIKEILDAIPPDGDYKEWSQIGMALKASGKTFEDWDNWSKEGEKYNHRDMRYKWDKSFADPPAKGEEFNGVSFGTIMYYLKLHNPEKFKEVVPKLLNKEECIFIEDIEGNQFRTLTNRSVAELFYNEFKDKYVFDTDWYMFDDESGIMKKLNKKMVEAYMLKDSIDYITNFLNNIIKNTEDQDKINKYYKIKNMTESSAFMKASFAFKETRFADADFKKQLDTSQDIFGFANGVYDMNELGGIFRKGMKTDYVCQYVDFDWTDATDHDFFDNLIYSMFEDQEMADWFKKHLGSIFFGWNTQEHFYFWDGSGRNGKGCVDTLLKSILGKFYCSLDVSHFTKYKKEANSPEPHLLKMNNTKLCMVNELGESTKLITDKIKQVSGNDGITCRACHSNDMINIDCSFKCIIQTNHLPNFTDIDDGLLDRICPIHFPFRFVSESVFDPENTQHRRADIKLKGVCKEKKVEFFNYAMSICVPAYRNHGITPFPKMVQKNINKYRAKIDDVGLFAKTELKEIPFLSGKEPIPTNSMYNHYQAWREQVVETEEYVSRDKFAKRLKAILGEGAYKRAMVDHKKQSCIVGYEFVNAYEYTPKTTNNNNNIYSRDY